jgi:hypothetical protein
MRPAGAHRSGLYVFHPASEHRRRDYLGEEPLGAQRFPLPPDVLASIRLWRAVVEDAMRLATSETVGSTNTRTAVSSQRARIDEIHAAREWISSSDFDDVCELARLSPAPFRRAVGVRPPLQKPSLPKLPPGAWREAEEKRRLRGQQEWQRAADSAWSEPWPERKKRKMRSPIMPKWPQRPPPPPWSPDEPEAPPGWEWHAFSV